MTTPVPTHYKPSGEITFAGVLSAITIGTGLAFLCSIPYAYITVYVPLIFINLIAVLGFGVIVGLGAAKGARAGNLTSPIAAAALGCVVGVFAVYCDWVWWVYAASRQEVFTLNPLALLVVASLILPEGTWGLSSGEPLTGWLLALVWLAEAGLIVGFAIVTAYKGVAAWICCPRCRKWIENPVATYAFAPAEDPRACADALATGSLAPLLALARTSIDTANRCLSLELFACDRCKHFACASLTDLTITRKKDDTTIKRAPLHNKLIIAAELAPAWQEQLNQAPVDDDAEPTATA
jgi:hypothetical protein